MYLIACENRQLLNGKMSCYFKHQQETTITIPSNVDINGTLIKVISFLTNLVLIPIRNLIQTFILLIGTTFFNIHVSIGNVHWTVRHRFKEFVDLHAKLVNGQSIGRDLLPPKKVNKKLHFCLFDNLCADCSL